MSSKAHRSWPTEQDHGVAPVEQGWRPSTQVEDAARQEPHRVEDSSRMTSSPAPMPTISQHDPSTNSKSAWQPQRDLPPSASPLQLPSPTRPAAASAAYDPRKPDPRQTDPRQSDPGQTDPTAAASASSQLPSTDPRRRQPAVTNAGLLDPRRTAAAAAASMHMQQSQDPQSAASLEFQGSPAPLGRGGGDAINTGPLQPQRPHFSASAPVGAHPDGAMDSMRLPAGFDLSSLDQLAAALGVQQVPSSLNAGKLQQVLPSRLRCLIRTFGSKGEMH
jgi:hypothetical protein